MKASINSWSQTKNMRLLCESCSEDFKKAFFHRLYVATAL